jgi:hypothetical protein
MKRISKAALVSAAILSAAFWTNPTDAGRQQPADPLSRALQEGGLKQLDAEVVRQLGEALGRNVLDVRVTPNARKPSAADHSRSGFIRPVALKAEESEERPLTVLDWFIYLSGLIAYPEGRPAQALILMPRWGSIGIRG